MLAGLHNPIRDIRLFHLTASFLPKPSSTLKLPSTQKAFWRVPAKWRMWMIHCRHVTDTWHFFPRWQVVSKWYYEDTQKAWYANSLSQDQEKFNSWRKIGRFTTAPSSGSELASSPNFNSHYISGLMWWPVPINWFALVSLFPLSRTVWKEGKLVVDNHVLGLYYIGFVPCFYDIFVTGTFLIISFQLSRLMGWLSQYFVPTTVSATNYRLDC